MARVLFGTLWAGLFIGFGVWFVRLSDGADGWMWGGLASLAAGNWLFVIVVANRLFRPRPRLVADIVEIVLTAALAVGVGVWMLVALSGGLR